MIPVRQRVVGTLGEPVRGDCFKCCVASLLERPYEEVPHVVQQEQDTGRYHMDLLNKWLEAEGYAFRALYRDMLHGAGYRDPIRWGADGCWEHYPGEGRRGYSIPGWWIATVRSKRFEGAHHCVVMQDGRMVHDPSDLYGTEEYDAKPYVFEGWVTLFHVPEPWRQTRTLIDVAFDIPPSVTSGGSALLSGTSHWDDYPTGQPPLTGEQLRQTWQGALRGGR